MPSLEPRHDPEVSPRRLGSVLYALGMLVGGFLLTASLSISTLFSPRMDVEIAVMFIGAMVTLPMLRPGRRRRCRQRIRSAGRKDSDRL